MSCYLAVELASDLQKCSERVTQYPLSPPMGAVWSDASKMPVEQLRVKSPFKKIKNQINFITKIETESQQPKNKVASDLDCNYGNSLNVKASVKPFKGLLCLNCGELFSTAYTLARHMSMAYGAKVKRLYAVKRHGEQLREPCNAAADLCKRVDC